MAVPSVQVVRQELVAVPGLAGITPEMASAFTEWMVARGMLAPPAAAAAAATEDADAAAAGSAEAAWTQVKGGRGKGKPLQPPVAGNEDGDEARRARSRSR